jgi:hypothetical protein
LSALGGCGWFRRALGGCRNYGNHDTKRNAE